MLFERIHYGALVTVLLLPLPTQAAEWSAEPKISLRTGYNDNIRLTTLDHDSVWETALTPAVRFGVAKEHQGLFGNASASIRRFSGGSGRESSSVLDREDYFLKTNAYHKTPRNTFKANLDYTRDSTLDSELDETGNVIDERATRERITLGPSWEAMLNETTRLELGYEYTDVSFSDDPGLTDLVEYEYDVFSSSLIHQLTPRIYGTLYASYSSYQPDTNLDSDTASIQAGISRNFSETLVASFLAGARKTTSDRVTGYCPFEPPSAFPRCTLFPPVITGTEETDNTGTVFSFDINKTLETGSLGMAISRSTNPNSDGELLDTTRLIVTGEHKFTETLISSLRLEYTENEIIVNRAGFDDSNQDNETFLRIKPKLSWRWQREWELAGEYEYAENEDYNSRTATRNAFYLTLTYRPTRLYMSR
ncbi:hypothetical protein N9089_01085 [Crocinitomicaceae bacterium]|nr:hypothetical protein [Crocinitomicaceae bacterium]